MKNTWFVHVIMLLIVFSAQRLLSQDDFYHPELEWKTIETPHFFINYHDGAERTAKVVAKVAEDIYEPVTSLYNHQPDQIALTASRNCHEDRQQCDRGALRWQLSFQGAAAGCSGETSAISAASR